jgi:hypothetical protein
MYELTFKDKILAIYRNLDIFENGMTNYKILFAAICNLALAIGPKNIYLLS